MVGYNSPEAVGEWVGRTAAATKHERKRNEAITRAMNMDIDISRRNKKPRLLMESERQRLDEFIDSIHYSGRYDTRDMREVKSVF